MRWVDQAITRPHRCAVLPYVGNGRGHAFLDTGQDLDREHVYISDAAAGEIARMLGWVAPAHVKALAAKVADLEQRLAQSEAEKAVLAEFKENVDGLGKHGLMLKKVSGRKPTKEKQEA